MINGIAEMTEDMVSRIAQNFSYPLKSNIDKPDGPKNPSQDKLHSNPSIPVSLNYRNEQERLSSFSRSPEKLKKNAEQLALCGFFYTDQGDQCECQFCGVVIDSWNVYDVPLDEHLKYSKNCPLLTGNTLNKPICIDKFNDMIERSKNTNRDVCGTRSDIIMKTNSVPETSFTNKALLNEPEYPGYRLKSARVDSFKEWPRGQLMQKPEDLSDAGFFYTGTGDRVLCFQCGGGLKDWDRDDVPWEQHALWYEKCEYVKLRMGLDYINQIKEKNNADVAKGVDDKVPIVEENNFRNNETINKENEEKEINKLCVICMDNEYNTVYIPCGHAVACDNCASSVSTCPYCRQKYENVIRIFLR